MRGHRSSEVFGSVIDARGSQVTVRESPSAPQLVWIFVDDHAPHMASAYLDPDQALALAATLVEFVKQHTPIQEDSHA
jgi:hypothetical protein